jgi:hypothetical protein
MVAVAGEAGDFFPGPMSDKSLTERGRFIASVELSFERLSLKGNEDVPEVDGGTKTGSKSIPQMARSLWRLLKMELL